MNDRGIWAAALAGILAMGLAHPVSAGTTASLPNLNGLNAVAAPSTLAAVAAQSSVARYFSDADGLKARLGDGREFALMPLPEALKQRLQHDAAQVDAAQAAAGGAAGAASPASAVSVLPILALSSPSVVDHRAYHGPIRNQGGRGTCVSFSTTAAVEGRYRRINPAAYAGLDLSEQWANHLQKMVSLPAGLVANAAWRESQMGCWGGSGNQYLLRVLKKYGLPSEAAMAYNPSGSYENTNEPGDSPKIDWQVQQTPQRTVDDFNLDPMTLPLTALGTAPYRPVGVTNLTYDQVRDPSILEGLVQDGYDVVFDISLVSPQVTTADGAWKPGAGATPRGAHSMLIVGYNRTKHYFLVRNSWGYDATDGGYTRVDYDYLQKFAYQGAYVTSVANPGADNARARLYVGRWKMNHDGWPGTLDIYRLPGLYQSAELSGQTDYRIGTYFDWSGKAHRVNGYLLGSDLVFYINFASPNAPYGSLGGTRFVAQIFSWDDQNLAGLELQDGVIYGFNATKATIPAHTAAGSPATLRDAFLGHWKMNHDGWKGDLYLSASGAGVAGSYKDSDGNWHSVTGSLVGRELRFFIWFGAWQEFRGYIYSWDKGLMSGVTFWGSTDFGYTAARIGN
jgi:Papain family cysteine protease